MRLPSQLIFFVTARCNLRCPACFYGKNLNPAGRDELGLDEIGKISASLNNLSRLLISGGEPFLRKDLAGICQTFYTQNHIRGIDLPTNGALTETIIAQTALILQKCPEAKLVLGLSLDGLAEIHDALRQSRGSFQLVLKTIKALAELKPTFPNLSLHIISVVSNKNINAIVPLIKFLCQNCDIDSFGPNPLRGSPQDKSLRPPQPEQWSKFTSELAVYYKYYAAKRFKSPLLRYISYARRSYLDKITTQVLSGKPLPFICRAGETIAVLEPNADVRLCELTEPVGNLRAVGYDFPKVWNSPTAAVQRRNIKDCACTHGCFLSPSIASNPYHLLRSLIVK